MAPRERKRTPAEEHARLARYAWKLIRACADTGEPRDALAAAVVTLTHIDELSRRNVEPGEVAETPEELRARRDAEVVALVGGRPALPPRHTTATYSWDEECARKVDE